MRTGVLLLAAVLIGAVSILALALDPGAPTTPRPPSDPGGEGGGEGFDVSIPTIKVAWMRVGGDVVITVTRAEPERPLDCRWTAWVWDVTNENRLFFGINLTNGVEPRGLPPGTGACTRTDPRFEFTDADGDRTLSVGDRWLLHDIPDGTEQNLVFVLTYWGTQEHRFRWGDAALTFP